MPLILAIGALIRIFYYIKPRSFWGDEWFTIFASSHGSLKDAVIASVNDVHPPLQFILFHFGGYRLFPFIAGLLSLYFFSKLSKDRLATLIFAISPYFIHLSGETRGYGFFCLFSILALLGYRWAFPCALFTAHYSWFLLLAIPFSVWFLPFLAGSAALIIHQTGTEQVFSSGRGFEWSVFSVLKKLIGLFLQFGGGVQYSFITPGQAMAMLKKTHLIFYILPAIFLFFSKNRRYMRLFAVTIAVLLLIYPIRLNARYLPFVGVAYLLLLTEGYRNFRYKVIANAIMGAFLAVNLWSLGWLFSVNYDPYHREDYIGASEFIEKNIGKNDGLIGCVDQVKFYTKKVYPSDGANIWEVYLGNPDMAVNEKHWTDGETRLKKKAVFKQNFGDLVWVIKYSGTGESD